ncbi:uncharacterized protein RAG0_16312 [Rhynchosporium agropyri]|uniref:Uncharacterized protein n=1 Tax=Rhynchosporium agropyri TaxID=914238 RepID=A0A1E1LPT7_9HELO|nr:uncharacterized protein RAG0_16312 [Rhynchosporium agropyri]
MSSLAVARGQSTYASSNPLRSRANTPHPLSPLSRKDSVALRPESRHSGGLVGFRNQEPFLAPRAWVRLTCSPHRADVLRVEPYLVDENGNSVVLRFTQDLVHHRYSSISRPSLSGRTIMAPPRTPVRQQTPINGDGDSPVDRASTCVTPDTPAPPPKDTPRPKMVSSVDKELPPKPILRLTSSPERRGLLDATDSASKRMTVDYPPLKPSNIGHRPSRSDTSFEVTPSLRSARGSASFEVGTASTKTSLKVQGLPVTITSQRSLRPTTSGFSSTASRIPGSTTTSTRRVTSLSHGGHIGAYKNGSPIQRYPSSIKSTGKAPGKFNRRQARDFQVLPDSSPDDGFKVQVEVDAEQTEETLESGMENFNISGLTLADDSMAGLPVQSDSDRRFDKLGVGPTVRYSKDAREVLMGKSPNVANTLKNSSNIGTSASVKLFNDSPYPRIPAPKKTVKEVKSKFQVNGSLGARVSHPTASSAARTQDAKAKVGDRKSSLPFEVKKATELKKSLELKKASKGIRSRVSDLLHGRRRAVQPFALKTPAAFIHKKSTGVQQVLVKSPAASIRNVSGIPVRKPIEVSSTNEPSDKLASDRDQRRVRGYSRALSRGQTTPAAVQARAHAANNSSIDLNDNGDEPPPPPSNSIEDLHAHYLEDGDNLQSEDARLSASIAGVQAMLNQIIVIAQGQSARYPVFRNIVDPIVANLSAGILIAQNARIAILSLRNSNQRAINDTLLLSEAIHQTAAQAIDMIQIIESMIPADRAA